MSTPPGPPPYPPPYPPSSPPSGQPVYPGPYGYPQVPPPPRARTGMLRAGWILLVVAIVVGGGLGGVGVVRAGTAAIEAMPFSADSPRLFGQEAVISTEGDGRALVMVSAGSAAEERRIAAEINCTARSDQDEADRPRVSTEIVDGQFRITDGDGAFVSVARFEVRADRTYRVTCTAGDTGAAERFRVYPDPAQMFEAVAGGDVALVVAGVGVGLLFGVPGLVLLVIGLVTRAQVRKYQRIHG